MPPAERADRARIGGFDLRNLHDAVLQEIKVKWGEAVNVEFYLLPNEAYIRPSCTVILRFGEVDRLICPQQNPWGPRDLVNSVVVENLVSSARVSVEMQSGDVIVVEGNALDIRTEGSSSINA